MPPPRTLTGDAARMALARSRLMLLFSPALCLDRDPLAVLEAALPHLDAVQVRPKPAGAGAAAPAPARETWEWSRRILDLLRGRTGSPLVLLVDDRVDVAFALRAEGVAGVHLGQEDLEASLARGILGAEALIGLSTHDMQQVAEAGELPVDYLGFGPVHATPTKGYQLGLGSEACWIASEAARTPVFPIGGIDLANAQELVRIGRSAVSSAILGAADPGRAARELRELLAGDEVSPGFRAGAASRPRS